MLAIYLYLLYMSAVETAVLDPALYLSPSPPLRDTTRDVLPAELWSSTRLEKRMECTTTHNPPVSATEDKTKEDSETMVKSETFWPFVRSPEISVGDVHIPLTFSVSGTYDKLHSASGALSTGYLKIPGSSSIFGSYGKSGLAGSGYGKYPIGYPNVKIYAGNNQPAWGGWGNGKWGHYGKG